MSMDKQIIFGIAPVDDGNPPVLVMGLPKPMWDDLQAGLTKTLDLTSIGVPIRVLLFGCDTHDAGMKTIMDAMAEEGIPVLDERRRDFGIKPKTKV